MFRGQTSQIQVTHFYIFTVGEQGDSIIAEGDHLGNFGISTGLPGN